MTRISIFDMLKVGIGPSSSHTIGPWRAVEAFLGLLRAEELLESVEEMHIDLYGSLAKTGRGHGTDIAVMMGLLGEDPTLCETEGIQTLRQRTEQSGTILLGGHHPIPFKPSENILFHFNESLPFHANGMRLRASLADSTERQETYYSVGGGFVVQEDQPETEHERVSLPYPCDTAADLLAHCHAHDLRIWEMVQANELAWRSPIEIRDGLSQLWETMLDCIFRGCHTEGQLPGGLKVVRRAAQMQSRLLGGLSFTRRDVWLAYIRQQESSFSETVKWVSCFALAVNEENAAFGRIVTAPTNGAAGVLPAVLMYYYCNYQISDVDIERFLMVAGEIGSLFKKGATISAAMGGCQAEIGVSSAMAAAALAEGLGATVEQALMAAEIAMEHHLGLTCDPIGGLVQIPCIERNAMGAMKAITAAHIALESAPEKAIVSLDAVIRTMWQTAQDMNNKYKETSEGGLALNIPVNIIEC